jgi:2-polyprenyl-3-methyl-5-hydroxy-6-metoxy-1,4-benzoquinol methylase
MRVVPKLKKATRSLVRILKQSRDDNFIGFDKYRMWGGYHWDAMNKSADYMERISALESFIRPEHSCLDLGCGDGAYMHKLSKLCSRIIGVDADFDAVRIATQKLAEHNGDKCSCFQLPLSKVNLRALKVRTKFDVVYSMDVLEHLPDPNELPEVAARMVKPGGLVAIGTPLFTAPELVSKYHVKEFTLEEIREFLSKHLVIKHELRPALLRGDGKTYPQGYYIGIGTPRA